MSNFARDRKDEVLGIIPARMASVRFPGKPLMMTGNLPMVIRVYRQVSAALSHVVIATGDEEIIQAAREYDARAVLTREEHASGTSRCQEAASILSRQTGIRYRAVINVQVDEPLITPEAITALASVMLKPGTAIATMVRRESNPALMNNPNRVKVVIDREGFALYFSRSAIPCFRDPATGKREWLSHTGIYAFRPDILEKLVRLGPSPLETAESLEQLRWMENGYRIRCCEIEYEGFGIDTPEDLEELNRSGKV